MDKRIRSIVIITIIGFVALTLNLLYIQVFNAESILSNPSNTRGIHDELAIQRGVIQTVDGQIVAKSEKKNNAYKRIYPKGEVMGQITGYYDNRFGRSALEQKYNSYLIGKAKLSTIQDYIDDIAGIGLKGNDIYLTINYKLQKVAYNALDGKKGAVVAIDPNTGAVLAIAGSPSFDPNEISEKWSDLVKDSRSPLLNRALLGSYAPGSSFKIISAAAALDLGISSLDKSYPAPEKINIYGGTVTNHEGHSYGNATLKNAFTKSINTVFGQLGVDIGAKNLFAYVNKFGFNKQIPFELDLKESSTSSLPKLSKDKLYLAWTSVGQAETLVTPFEMALVGATVANSGKMMKPYLVEKIRSYKGQAVLDTKPEKLAQVIRPKTAADLKALCLSVVSQGTGTAAAIEGVEVAGKTGTAEVKGMKPHAWFVGFAPAEKPKIAVAVLVENSGMGGVVAAPIARQVMEAFLSSE